MIVNCPQCKKPMSSVAPLCPKCGFARGDVTEEQLTEFQRRKLRDRIYHLKMTSYFAISLLLAACGWYWWESSDFSRPPSAVPIILVALGTVGYLVTRVLLFRAKKALRKLR